MISKDTAIVCPKCWKEIGRTARAINFGEPLHFNDFNLFPRPPSDHPWVSMCCQVPWYYQGSLSLAEGWIPPNPIELEPE